MWTPTVVGRSLHEQTLRALFATIIAWTILGGTVHSELRPEVGPVSRFLILGEFQGEAVLDRETQLIWERTPSPVETRWANAELLCAMKSVGGRRGWRLPTFFELMTLVDPASHGPTTRPLLPVGNPFTGIGERAYWSSNTQAIEPTKAYTVDFIVGDLAAEQKHSAHRIWCVHAGRIPPPNRNEENIRKEETIWNGHQWS